MVVSLRSEWGERSLVRKKGGVTEDLAHLRTSMAVIHAELQSIKNVLRISSGGPQREVRWDSIWRGGSPCGTPRKDPPEGREWHVAPSKYLVAGCFIGGFSNRMETLLATSKLANALRRTLVIAPFKALEEGALGITGDFDPLGVLDLELAQACVGEGRVMSWDQFTTFNQGLSTFGLCIHFPGGEERCERGHKVGRDTLGVPFETKDINGYEVKDLAVELKFPADVLWVAEAPHLGDMWNWQPKMNCSLEWDIFQPSAAIRLAAHRFIAGMLGADYASFHLRRGDFFDYIDMEADPGTFSRNPVFTQLRYTVTALPKLAHCLARAVDGSNLTTFYVASDASQWEMDNLRELLASRGAHMVTLPPHQEWDKHRWARGLAQNTKVAAMLDKFLCTAATMFVSSRGSIFSNHVTRARRAWSLDTCHDHEVCTLPGDEDDFTFSTPQPIHEGVLMK
ncbi:O-fucosyltransferase family protein [Klebsormidium nitens]|uniref:GDP-fucose protein O-fucosyltransferase 2 n=1 Tax=Klebsormidium nitens TaxID=105231 RepID=A0A1Y1IG34_KLENI|nr:O-fucosyltransferase family protein [Klebsormidium nitens]|eukprot:GAQ87068.1 O-fucosyltransferase family protein [Klebsormidium nitens]